MIMNVKLPCHAIYFIILPGMGVFHGKENLSKVLIFKWVMVPKMIAGLISYEAERRTRVIQITFVTLMLSIVIRQKRPLT
jgi:hypothetical protein